MEKINQEVICNHFERKQKARGLCRSCYDKWLKLTNPAYKERQKLTNQLWVKNNPDKNKLIQQRRQIREKTDPIKKEKRFLRSIKRKYGCTEEQYYALLKASNNICMLCFKKPAASKRLHLDHCHKTGRIRGLLCADCNWYLSKVDSDISLLDRIKVYITKE